MEAIINGYAVYALDNNGTLWCLNEQGWGLKRPRLFMTLAFARFAGRRLGLPDNTVDAYLLSTESNTTFDFQLGHLQLAVAAMTMVEDGHISYENAEILARLKRTDWQLQFLSEARDLTSSEFADLIHGVNRRIGRVTT